MLKGGEILKCVKIVAVIISVCLLFTGCSFRIASSVDELISPVSPTGENENIQNTLSNYCKGGFSLKTPAGGKFTTAYTFFDYDGDNEQEAVVFYEPASSLGTIDMALMDKTGDSWSVIYNLEGEGSDIYSVDFCDLNGDNVLEFIVLWDVISNSSNHIMTVYSQGKNNDGFVLNECEKELTINNYITVDVDNDNKNELVAFFIESGDKISANAVLYYFEDNSLKFLGNTKLDGHINSYKNFSLEETDGTVYIYADAVKSNGTQMLTEIIYWSDYYNTIISPFYSYSTGVTKRTTRNSMITSRDINGDGKIEIPLDSDISVPAGVNGVDWQRYENTVLDHKAYSLAVEKDNYQLIIPDDMFENIKITYDASKSLLTISDDEDKLIFSVLTVLKSHYSENQGDYSGYNIIGEDAGYVYLSTLGSDARFILTQDDVKNMLKSYKGE